MMVILTATSPIDRRLPAPWLPAIIPSSPRVILPWNFGMALAYHGVNGTVRDSGIFSLPISSAQLSSAQLYAFDGSWCSRLAWRRHRQRSANCACHTRAHPKPVSCHSCSSGPRSIGDISVGQMGVV
jgi:hypothetical protein